MTKVAQELVPKLPDDKRRSDGFFMNDLLRMQLDYYIKNVHKDWDFTIIIAGEGEVRVGKSVLAQQIAAYWVSEVKRLYGKKKDGTIDEEVMNSPWSVKDNILFTGSELIRRGNYLGTHFKYAVMVFDEAGADLEGIKAMKATTQAVKDYFRECGQYNMLNILVLPEFFDLPKGIAISRSSCLINVYYIPNEEGMFERGFFKFYSKPRKKMLYLRGKKDLDYSAWKPDFLGNFDNIYTVPIDEYRAAKKEALKRREDLGGKEAVLKAKLYGACKILQENGYSVRNIASEITARCGIRTTKSYIGALLNKEEVTDDLDFEKDD